MDRLKTDILIIGENLYSIFLARLLKDTGAKILILSLVENTLFNPILKFYSKHKESYATAYNRGITKYLDDLYLIYRENFSPIDILYSTNDIIKAVSLPRLNNYFEYSIKNSRRLLFVHIENLEYLFNLEEDGNKKIYKSRLFNKDRIYSIYELTNLLESNEKALDELISFLKSIKIEEDEIFVLPPILGMNRTDEIISKIKNSINREVFELITPDSPVLLRRFYLRLKEMINKESVKQIKINTLRHESKDRLIKKIISKDYEIEAHKIILATGRYLEGGLTVKDNKVVEPLFNIPVFLGSDKNFITYFTREDILSPQPFLRCGIRVDNRFRPVNEAKEILFENLYSCGSIIENNFDVLINLSQIEEFAKTLKEGQ